MYEKIKNYLSTLEGHISWATVVQTMFFTYEFCGAYAAHKKVDIFKL